MVLSCLHVLLKFAKNPVPLVLTYPIRHVPGLPLRVGHMLDIFIKNIIFILILVYVYQLSLNVP